MSFLISYFLFSNGWLSLNRMWRGSLRMSTFVLLKQGKELERVIELRKMNFTTKSLIIWNSPKICCFYEIICPKLGHISYFQVTSTFHILVFTISWLLVHLQWRYSNAFIMIVGIQDIIIVALLVHLQWRNCSCYINTHNAYIMLVLDKLSYEHNANWFHYIHLVLYDEQVSR